MANLSNIITPTNVLTASSTNTLTNKTISGASNTITNVPLSTGVTGTLPVANGGTNATATPTAGAVAYGTGTAYAFTSAGTAGQLLQSNGAGAPTWATISSGSTIKSDMAGYSAIVTTSSNIIGASGLCRPTAVNLTSTTEIVLFAGESSLHAAVWNNSTRTFGTPTLVRTGNFANGSLTNIAACKISSTAVLVCSLPNANSVLLETVVLTVSGSTITVGTPVATTLASNSYMLNGPSSFNNFPQRLMAFGSSFVLSYADVINVQPCFRAITVSGSTPTVGSELTFLAGSTSTRWISLPYSSSILLHLSASSLSFFAVPISVSGTTLTQGTQATTTASSTICACAGMLSSGRAFAFYQNANYYAAIITVSGTTASISSVDTGQSANAYAQIIGSKVSYTMSLSVNTVTDNAGTPSLGTQLTLSGATSCTVVGYAGNEIFVNPNIASGLGGIIYKINVSGSSPVVSQVVPACITSSATGVLANLSNYDLNYANVENSGNLVTVANKHVFATVNTNYILASYDGVSQVAQFNNSFIGPGTNSLCRSTLNQYSAFVAVGSTDLRTQINVRYLEFT